MPRSASVNFATTPEVYLRLRRLAFMKGWTLSKTADQVVARGLPLLEGEVTEADESAWMELVNGVWAERA